ncbi:hypothetical protein GALMADRAFT_256966 [Galerina marginata CBS 339.88]|uniref:Potassium channel domain-containing protein n=1 Tax=Galerina marginata (strain CBS 339.88) TaxID=685588 RepID=A0A067SKU1_GALM3|nr:hypothetical protein GALMADRAFT_256966 [Galerina marginata CBS 339.88]
MLVLPGILRSLLPPTQTKNRRQDVEKDVERNSPDPIPRAQQSENDQGLRRRPASLDLADSEGLRAFLDGPDNADSTRTYRLLPIFSGIMIPFSIMLSIPSLTGHWYIRTGDNNVLLETRPNPPLLDAAMGLSMGCGVLASTCLVIRFAERKIKLTTMLCIIFLSLHDLINIPAVTIFGVEHRFDDGFTYGQSFWFTVCSTIASTATNITLITDYYRTKDFTHSGSGLTHKQRSLVIIIIVLLCYVSLGSLILAVMLGINFIDALYLSVVSIETIGFGDLHPGSTGTRIFTCLYIAGGILNLALAVALTRDALLESAAINFRARLKAVEARQRERHIRSRWRAAVRWRLRAKGCPTWVDDRDEERKLRVGLRRHHHWYSWLRHVWRRLWDELWREWEDPAWKYVYGRRHKRLNLEALTEAQLKTAALEAGAPLFELVPKGLKLRGSVANGQATDDVTEPNPWFPTSDTGGNSIITPPLTHVRMGGMITLLGRFALAVTHGIQHEPQNTPISTDDGDEPGPYDDTYTPTTAGRGVPFTRTMTMTTMQEDVGSLAESLENEERNAFRARLTVALTLFIVFWMAGSAVFMQTEKWTFGSAVYFCFVSFTTVGYGDFAPKTPAGRSIFVVWALLGVGTMTILISILAEAYSSQYKSVIKSEVLDETSTAFYDANGAHQPPYDSRTILNTGSDQFAPGSGLSSSSISFSNTPRVVRSRRPTMAPIPELQPSTENTHQQVNEQPETLPHQVLRHADTLRSLISSALSNEERLSLDGNVEDDRDEASALRKMENLLAEIEKSLEGVSNAARDALYKPEH